MNTKVGIYKDESKGQWRVRWYGRYDPKKGKQKRYSKTFRKKKDAEQFKKQKEGEFNQGVSRDPSNETLKDYADRWLKYKTQVEGIRPATVILYKETLNRLYDYFGNDRLLRSIKFSDAKDFLASLKPIMKGKKSLSDWAKHRVLRQCKTLFSDVVKDGIMPQSPFVNVKVSKGKPSEWYYLKPDEFHRLLNAAPTLQEKALYALAYTAGLRESEALALYWTNIDFESGELKIVNRPASETYPPFNVKDSDARIIPLPKFTIDLLTQLHNEAPENVPFVLMNKAGANGICRRWKRLQEQDKDWLNRYWANNVIRKFHVRVKRAEIKTAEKKLTVHVLRKCCIQNWANELPMNVVKELAGHSSIETTNEFYSTVDKSHREAAAKIGDKLLGGNTSDLFLTFSGNSAENKAVNKC